MLLWVGDQTSWNHTVGWGRDCAALPLSHQAGSSNRALNFCNLPSFCGIHWKVFPECWCVVFFLLFFKRMCSSGCIFKINARLPRLLNIETCLLLKSVTFWGKLQGLCTQRAQSGGENQAEYSTLVFMTASEHVHQICSIKPIKNLMTNQIMQDFWDNCR